MDDNKKTGTQQETAQVEAAQNEALKQKYGCKLYEVGITVPVDDTTSKSYTYRFKRPTNQSYDRYISTAAKVGITKASRTFMLDAVIDEDKTQLEADLEENPGIAVTIGNKLTEILGLSDSVNLRKL